MTKSILIWGAPSYVNPAQSITDCFNQSGKNFGNLLIGNAMHVLLANNPIVNRSSLKSPEEANERCSHVVIPAANFLWKDFDFGYMADFLEKTTLPVTIVGVGAQTHDRSVSSQIHPNTLRLMHLISERSASLGVRGYYTAEVLAANGIHNIRVIGCPSLYTKRNPTIKIDTSRLASLEDLSVNFSRRVHGHSFFPEKMKKLENALLKFALAHKNSTFVAQDEIEELDLHTGQEVNTAQITDYFNQTGSEQVIKFFTENTRYFCDESSWSSYIRTQSASVGTRFHGNLIALINGVPALTIVHDSRTMEMCTLMGIPTIHVSQIDVDDCSEETLQELLLSCSFEKFEKSYQALYSRFVGFLNENGLNHNLPDVTALI